ncbi:MAG: hypothetical protein QJR02_01475 [Sinobacteraceae bacterium]|nr:hypothetical protein [Nevskiaceae bacterium]
MHGSQRVTSIRDRCGQGFRQRHLELQGPARVLADALAHETRESDAGTFGKGAVVLPGSRGVHTVGRLSEPERKLAILSVTDTLRRRQDQVLIASFEENLGRQSAGHGRPRHQMLLRHGGRGPELGMAAVLDGAIVGLKGAVENGIGGRPAQSRAHGFATGDKGQALAALADLRVDRLDLLAKGLARRGEQRTQGAAHFAAFGGRRDPLLLFIGGFGALEFRSPLRFARDQFLRIGRRPFAHQRFRLVPHPTKNGDQVVVQPVRQMELRIDRRQRLAVETAAVLVDHDVRGRCRRQRERGLTRAIFLLRNGMRGHEQSPDDSFAAHRGTKTPGAPP